MAQRYQELLVWEKAHRLVLEIYKASSEFPAVEQFGIIHQLRRASYSIPANLAEGCQRHYIKEFIRFVTMARGSLAETEYFLLLSKDLGYLKEDVYSELVKSCSEIGKMLNGLFKSLKDRS